MFFCIIFADFFSEKDDRDVRTDNYFLNFFRVAYVDRDASPKKNMSKKHAFFLVFFGSLGGPDRRSGQHTEPCHRMWVVLGYATMVVRPMLQWLIHPPKLHSIWAYLGGSTGHPSIVAHPPLDPVQSGSICGSIWA